MADNDGSPTSMPQAPAEDAPAPAGPGARRRVEELRARLARTLPGPTLAWAAAALVCVGAGVTVSVLEARAVAHRDAASTRRTFHTSSGEIASRVKLAIQHSEDLIIGASTFLAANPKATPGEFAGWARWLQPLRRYPELQRLELVAMVSAPELAVFAARLTGRPLAPVPSAASTAQLSRGGSLASASVSRSASSTGPSRPAATAPPATDAAALEGLRVVPPGTRPFYCLAIAGLRRGGGRYPPLGADYCASNHRLLASRDSATSSYTRTTIAGVPALAVDMPVYRGDAPPRSIAQRRASFLGWVRETLEPGVLLAAALRGHPEDAARMRHRTGAASAAFATGDAQAGAQSASASLPGGWTLRSFGPPADGSVWHGEALAILIGGSALSALLAVLVLLLGLGRPQLGSRGRRRPGEELYDPLTGLPNRMLTLDRAERMLARSRRQSGLLVGALFIDIDWLEDINEKLGKEAGDELLKIVAERLGGVIRAQDTLGRLGGDEFVLLVESAGAGVRLEGLARRVIEALHKRVELEGFGPAFIATASIGVAFGRYASCDDLLRDARLALNSAKAAGKDRYTVFNANMRAVIEGRGLLEADLGAALTQHQLYLLYQPVYDLETREVVSLEALVRWRHPRQGVLPLSEFLPLAEETGLIVPLGRWVLAEACTRAAAWNVAGHRVGVSVNVSANQLNRAGFVTDVQRALQQSGVDPATLTIEVDEATVMLDVEATAARLAEIKQLGAGIAIDGFGTGYAYRADLARLPLDVLKVDRRSLSEAEDEHYRSWLLEAILVLGRDLSLTVVAKGVETYEQLSVLEGLGFTLAQGFFLGRPVSEDAVASLFGATPSWQPAPPLEHAEPGAAALEQAAPGGTALEQGAPGDAV